MPYSAQFDSITAQAVVTVATGTAAALSATQVGARAVVLQSDPTNTANIYLGSSSSLTAAPVLAYAVLRPGEWRVFPLNNVAEVFAISATASQKLLVGAAS